MRKARCVGRAGIDGWAAPDGGVDALVGACDIVQELIVGKARRLVKLPVPLNAVVAGLEPIERSKVDGLGTVVLESVPATKRGKWEWGAVLGGARSRRASASACSQAYALVEAGVVRLREGDHKLASTLVCLHNFDAVLLEAAG